MKLHLIAVLLILSGPPLRADSEVSLSAFDTKASSGGQINVVFFGGSLTWGANSTDPQIFSYRAIVGEMLRDKYPKSRIHLWDSAIGGTNSQLGVFRLDRDVLSHKPDLVFLEFTVNDAPIDKDRLAAYEAIIRRLIAAHCAVFQVILPVKANIGHPPPPLHLLHQNLAEAYNVPSIDATAYVSDRVQAAKISINDLWSPGDATHPTNAGYRLYAESIWARFMQAISEKKGETLPAAMIYPATYMNTIRQQLASGTLVPGWTTGLPNRNAANFDWVMSRWLDSIVSVANPPDQSTPLERHFSGTTIVLFGEATPKSGKFSVSIDGRASTIYDASAAQFGGNGPLVRVLAQGLQEDKHTISIQPIVTSGQELRIESLCVAGALPWLNP